ncbi:hypothetical protein KIPB_016000, partial [Kipferlia bialata]|eukprot:g16000.t1
MMKYTKSLSNCDFSLLRAAMDLRRDQRKFDAEYKAKTKEANAKLKAQYGTAYFDEIRVDVGPVCVEPP